MSLSRLFERIDLWKLSGRVIHALHAFTGLVAFFALFNVHVHGLASAPESVTGERVPAEGPDLRTEQPAGFGVDVQFKRGELSIPHLLPYLCIGALSVGLAIALRRVRNSNCRLPHPVVDTDREEQPPRDGAEYVLAALPSPHGSPAVSADGTGAARAASAPWPRLVITQVRNKEQFREFFRRISKAYPSGLISNLTHEMRWNLYYRWMESGEGYLAVVDRVDGAAGDTCNAISTEAGFVAVCRIKSEAFCRWAAGKSAGVEYRPQDLGCDNDGETYVDVKHWYLHRRRSMAPREAMLWLLGHALRNVVRPGTTPVVFAQTVTDIAESNYRALGFFNIGPSSYTRRPQFLLDGRHDPDELSDSARWTLKHLCRADEAIDPATRRKLYRRPAEMDDDVPPTTT